MGLLALTIKLLIITLKQLYLTPPDLVTFVFRHILSEFLAKSIHRGGGRGGGGLLQLLLK